MLQTLIGAALVNGPLLLPGLENLRVWDPRGLGIALLLHVGFSEPVFYWAHRALHSAPLFGQYHAGHHSTPVTQPLTGTYSTRYAAAKHGCRAEQSSSQPNPTKQSQWQKRRDKACVPVLHGSPVFFL